MLVFDCRPLFAQMLYALATLNWRLTNNRARRHLVFLLISAFLITHILAHDALEYRISTRRSSIYVPYITRYTVHSDAR